VDGLSDAELALLLAGIGAGSALIGTIVAWLLQARLAKRQRVWAVEDLRNSQQHDASMRDRDLREQRFQLLRSERREVYARALDGVEEFIAALRDLRDTEVPNTLTASNTLELETVDPISAQAMRCLKAQRRLDSDVILIADSGVRDSFLRLSQLLRAAFRQAVQNQDGLKPVHSQLNIVLMEMRRELVGPKPESPSPPVKAGDAPADD